MPPSWAAPELIPKMRPRRSVKSADRWTIATGINNPIPMAKTITPTTNCATVVVVARTPAPRTNDPMLPIRTV